MKYLRYLIMKTAFILTTLTVFLHFGCSSQGNGKVNWMTFEEAIEANRVNPKKIFIDVYTDWCGWCKKWIKELFQIQRLLLI